MVKTPLKVGVLALQGDFARHVDAVTRAAEATGRRVEIVEVRRPGDLRGLHGIVLPGGESTTLLKLLAVEDLGIALGRFASEQGGAVLATCAGAILVSREVQRPAQASLGLLDATIERNAYGRQVDSFIASLRQEPGAGLGDEPLEAVFIRAPRFRAVGSGVQVLARHDGEPVLVKQGRILAATFHPELTADARVHAAFLEACAA